MARTKTKELTREQEELFLLIRDWVECRNIQPTLRSLADELGIVNSAVNARLSALIDKGYIESEGKNRSRILTVKRQSVPRNEMVQIPILGDIAAGEPIWAEQHFKDQITVSKEMLGSGNFFALEIKGNSMINAGINDGDIVVIRQQPLANHGEIIAAYLNGSATLKRLHHKGNEISLLPENPAYNPLDVASSDDFRIMGVFKFVVRITQTFIFPKQ